MGVFVQEKSRRTVRFVDDDDLACQVDSEGLACRFLEEEIVG